MKILAALCLLIALSGPSIAAPIGAVSENKGSSCSIERGKIKLEGNKGASIEPMDAYVTGACTSAITFKDASNVRITENSRLVIDDFVYDPNKSDAGRLALKVGMGTVRYASGQIAKSNSQNVAIRTPTATIAVRGTDFTMTVDETGQSLIVLLPSCKDPTEVKTFEMEENKCKVGRIEVSNAAGTVTLDRAFESTYVSSANHIPTAPIVISIVESRINNNLIISKPPEVQKAIAAAASNVMDKEKQQMETEAKQGEKRTKDTTSRAVATNNDDKEQSEPPAPGIDVARLLTALLPKIDLLLPKVDASLVKTDILISKETESCNPVTSICIRWETPSSDAHTRGKGTAYREAPSDHYVEVKTQGQQSNTTISITHDNSLATYIIGDGLRGANIVTIRQSGGLRRP